MHDDKVTTPTISTLLLVPAAGDPMGLLAEGPCGARPPMMHEPMPARGREPVPWAAGPPPRGRDYYARALVLAHDGKPVRQGCDIAEWARLEIAITKAGGDRLLDTSAPGRNVLALVALALRYGAAEFRVLSRRLASIGTLIALDPAGWDVTDEVMRG